MNRLQETFRQLSGLPDVSVLRDEPLAAHTRFGIGGPADLFIRASAPDSFIQALGIARANAIETVVVGEGTNLIVADEGFRGAVLQLANSSIAHTGRRVRVDAGLSLQRLVDYTVDLGLGGLETMTGIPGSVGAAIYGNAGAYGHSIAERIDTVRFFDGSGVREIARSACEFHYRESVFKRRKEWIVFSAELLMAPADAARLRETADRILETRNRKYPPAMKCAGSIFKNLLFADLPAGVAAAVPAAAVIEGKVPSAWFLEHAGAKGMRCGEIQVADYHANLIYNDGHGTARQLAALIGELKQRVRDRWGIAIEEEVQYIGFPPAA